MKYLLVAKRTGPRDQEIRPDDELEILGDGKGNIFEFEDRAEAERMQDLIAPTSPYPIIVFAKEVAQKDRNAAAAIICRCLEQQIEHVLEQAKKIPGYNELSEELRGAVKLDAVSFMAGSVAASVVAKTSPNNRVHIVSNLREISMQAFERGLDHPHEESDIPGSTVH